MPRKLYRRVFRVRIPPAAKGELERFLEALYKAIRSYGAVLRIKGDQLVIEVYGDRAMILDSWTRIKELISDYSRVESSTYPARLIFKEVGLALPLDIIAEVLSLKGYSAAIEEEDLRTDAPYDEVISTALSVKEALEDTKLLYATRTAKKLVVAASALLEEDPHSVIERAIELGLARFDEEGKFELLKPWREALRELVGRTRVEHSG
ncbi:MAG: DUF2067 domain-containing protein [Desulfurococcales archaeon]|nr:DUF2067 domain-containing protein [Desulfurococcales archaeon]